MSCAGYKSWIEDAAIGALDERRASELHAHLEECTACSALLERERALAAAIDSSVIASVSGEPAPYFASRVRARIAEEPQRSSGFVQWLPLTAGALAVVFAVGIWLSRTRPGNVGPSIASAPVTSAANNRTPTAVVTPHKVPTTSATRRRSSGPRVLIARDEQLGFMHLYQAARKQRMDAEALLDVEKLRKPLDTPELTIAPLQIAAMELLPPAETSVGPPGTR